MGDRSGGNLHSARRPGKDSTRVSPELDNSPPSPLPLAYRLPPDSTPRCPADPSEPAAVAHLEAKIPPGDPSKYEFRGLRRSHPTELAQRHSAHRSASALDCPSASRVSFPARVWKVCALHQSTRSAASARTHAWQDPSRPR